MDNEGCLRLIRIPQKLTEELPCDSIDALANFASIPDDLDPNSTCPRSRAIKVGEIYVAVFTKQ